MPTERPRVVAYPSPAIYQRLKQYQREKRVTSLSAALIQVLEDFFAEVDTKETAPAESEALTAINQELRVVRQQVEQLFEVVRRMDENSQSGRE